MREQMRPRDNLREEEARRELDKIFPDNLSQSWGEAMIPALKATVMAWHLRHVPPPPTREAILAVLNRRMVAWDDRILDDLLALFRSASLSQGSGKSWCKHMIYDYPQGVTYYGLGKHWVLVTEVGDKRVAESNWDICPVAGCHAPRPQDNPQEDGNA